jgi:hypothetical protein
MYPAFPDQRGTSLAPSFILLTPRASKRGIHRKIKKAKFKPVSLMSLQEKKMWILEGAKRAAKARKARYRDQ